MIHELLASCRPDRRRALHRPLARNAVHRPTLLRRQAHWVWGERHEVERLQARHPAVDEPSPCERWHRQMALRAVCHALLLEWGDTARRW
ncbi:MAG: hypothetical protein RMK60_04345 [Burkholderiales bacterium]|nr:hypothetical protein [Burkholderiales bacterium]